MHSKNGKCHNNNFNVAYLWIKLFLKLTRSIKLFLLQITIEAEVLQENDDDEETRVRFSFIPNIQTTAELKGTGMQGVKRKSLMFANLILLVFQV